MPTTTLSSKGQIVIPKPIRDHLCLHAGDQLDFVVSDTGDVVLKPAKAHVSELFGMLYTPGRKPVSVEVMKAVVRRRATRSCRT